VNITGNECGYGAVCVGARADSDAYPVSFTLFHYNDWRAYSDSMADNNPTANITPVRVVVGDSTRMSSQLLADALSRDPQLSVVKVCTTAEEIMAVVSSGLPHVLVVSANLEENPQRGFDVCRDVRTTYPSLAVVMLLDRSKRDQVLAAFAAGARGIFCRSESLDVLRKCIFSVYRGQVWANSLETSYLLEAFAETTPTRLVDARGTELLSKREQEVVRCVTDGLTNREIAARLKLSEHTVKNYIFRIFDKLGVSTRVEMVLYTFSQRGASALSLAAGNWSAPETSSEVERHARAAEQGIGLAQLKLGELYRDGRGVPQDKVAAGAWFLLAQAMASDISARASAALEQIRGSATRQELEQMRECAAARLQDHGFNLSSHSMTQIWPRGEHHGTKAATSCEAPSAASGPRDLRSGIGKLPSHRAVFRDLHPKF
jgi:two-component system, NarL family, nitrate/nitrite response regulator NarL